MIDCIFHALKFIKNKSLKNGVITIAMQFQWRTDLQIIEELQN